LRGPVLGFFGLIHDWIDLDLIGWLAERRPAWNLVMIGKVAVDNARIRHLANIHWLGRQPYEKLPSYCRRFDVGLIPFVLNELTRNVNPIKLREYLSAGVPVVSTNLPEVALCQAQGWCAVAHSREDFLMRCEEALATASPEARRKRSEAMRTEDWDNKVAQIGAHVMRVKAAKGRA
jgi:glycosyltransferase involved in cell wall biosynthesis